jgi:hypothetical protein
MRSQRGDPSPAPIPPEFLGAWWRAAENAPPKVASDYYRFQLLTGCRGGGDLRTQVARVPADQGGGRRPSSGQGAAAGHQEPERSQAAAVQAGTQIAKRNCAGRRADEAPVPDRGARKTLRWINEEAGNEWCKATGCGRRLRASPRSSWSSALMKRMMNHAAAGDVTLGHYVAKSEAQLRRRMAGRG